MTTTRHERVGDRIVQTTTRVEEFDAIVDFRDIVASAEVSEDPDMGPPWKEHDGWEHEITSPPDRADYERMRGYVRPHGYRSATIVRPDFSVLGDYAYFRRSGMSRQVAREVEACERRRMTDQLVRWHEDGYHWWQILVRYRGCVASLGGIQIEDDAYPWHDPYIQEEIAGLAEEVASELEDEGYTIINRPEEPKRYGKQRPRTREVVVNEWRQRLNGQNVDDPRPWGEEPHPRGFLRWLERMNSVIAPT